MLKITSVEKDGIAFELGIKAGDNIVSFDKFKAVDMLDYLFYDSKNIFTMEIMKKNGKIELFEIEKDDCESLGIEFLEETDEIKRCQNKCIFCFIDQLPKNLRSSLYVKDDDYKMSFLCGNFVTLTNLNDGDIDRIIRLHLSPLYLSIHTLNEKLRADMMNNKFAGKITTYLEKLRNANIEMHTQIVLCKGVNDGLELEYTVRKLHEFSPEVKSVAVVPVGLTKYREGLKKLDAFDFESATNVIDKLRKLNAEFKENFVCPADEFYFLAKRDVEKEEFYGDYSQIENGVGITRKFYNEFIDSVKKIKLRKHKKILCISGVSAKNFNEKLAGIAMENIENLELEVLAVKNDFFGQSITCSGLITGTDILNQVSGNYDEIIIQRCMLKEFEEVFLDDMTVIDLSIKLKTKISISEGDGESYFQIISKEK